LGIKNKAVGSQYGAHQEVRPAPAQLVPGFVTHIANDGLNDQSGDRGGDPENGDLVYIRPQRLKDPAYISVLQGKSELDPEESKTHVPYLPEA
jgi:hypothetical protein